MTPRLWVLLAALSACLTLTLTADAAATESRALSATLAPEELGALSDQASISGASTSASIVPSLSPDRHRAKASLTVAINYSGGELGVPSPVRSAVLGLPAGLSLNIPVLRSCTAEILLARGVSGCPAQSLIGIGHATALFNLGSQPVLEHVKLWAFLGPLRNLQPTFEILGEGFKPLGREMVLTATALPDRAPYGEEMTMSIPPIPTVPGEPDASIVSFSLTIGASVHKHTPGTATVVVPTHCPHGGLPFAAAFTYANGSQGSALATVPCPV
jgi:hypothetical protein